MDRQDGAYDDESNQQDTMATGKSKTNLHFENEA
jgi:hypothetical protein